MRHHIIFLILLCQFYPVGKALADVPIVGTSSVFTFDTKPPVITLLAPNGGQSYPASQPIIVSWSAWDDLPGGSPMAIEIKTSATGGYSTLMTGLYNAGWQSVQPPCISTTTARFRVRMTDLFGNTAADTSDNWFTLTNGGTPATITLTQVQTGTPLAGATILALAANQQFASQPSATPGQYQLFAPPGNGYTLQITATGYEPKEVKNVNIPAGQPVTLSYSLTPLPGYGEYRVVPLAQVPNPALLEIPEGGTGYAWFLLEGLTNGSWKPATNLNVVAQDEQGNQVQCISNHLVYTFMTGPLITEHDGVFGVKIPAQMVGNGAPGAQETFTIESVQGVPLPMANQQSVVAKVKSFSYRTTWDYRIFGRLGFGGGLTGVSATGFAGGGSGSVFSIGLEGSSPSPPWSDFTISRRHDLFLGAEVAIGAPELLAIETPATRAEFIASFPRESTYAFQMNTLPGLESLLAFYLYYEPMILFAGKIIPGGVICASMLNWMTEALIQNASQYNLGVSRVSEEAGIDLKGELEGSVRLGLAAPNAVSMAFGPSLGYEAHVGSSLKKNIDGTSEQRYYLTGKYNSTLGPKLMNVPDFRMEKLYPYRFLNGLLPVSAGTEFQTTQVKLNNNFQSWKLTYGVESNSDWMNIYNIGGMTHRYKSWFSTEETGVRDLLFTSSELHGKVAQIGESTVSMTSQSNTCELGGKQFLSAIYNMQEAGEPLILGYGIDAEANSSFSLDLDLSFPLTGALGVNINIGGGMEASHTIEYPVAQGYWMKGLPYLQSEMPVLPSPQITIQNALTTLWNHVTSGQTLAELRAVLQQYLESNSFRYNENKSTAQIVPLNPEGSRLEIHAQSIPASLDSVIFKHWEWEETGSGDRVTAGEQRARLEKSVRNVRNLRQAASGLTFGIGGFYSFEPSGYNFGDSTRITIVYPDSAVSGIDEATLAVYREDSLGLWHYIPSTPEPDSNRVSATIGPFSNYTLAPLLPYGSYGFNFSPDTLPANGTATSTAMSDLIRNPDSSLIGNGIPFNVTVNRGAILTPDADTLTEGHQILSAGGRIILTLRADTLAKPMVVTATSVQGYAMVTDSLRLFDLLPPQPPVITSAVPVDGAVILTWSNIPDPDLAGFLLFYDTDTIVPPYDGTANVWGLPSPVNTGMTNSFRLTGMSNYSPLYLAIKSYDIQGNESDFSTPVMIQLNPPPAVLTVGSDTLGSGTVSCFNATDTLLFAGNGAQFLVNSGATADAIAGKVVRLLPGTKARSGSHFHAMITQDESFCSRIGQSGPPAQLGVENITVSGGTNRCFNATGILTVAGNGSQVLVASGGNATFIAGEKIVFLPGLMVNNGGNLQGYIATENNYCEQVPDHPEIPGENGGGDMVTVSQNNSAGIRLYPNPTSGSVTVESYGQDPHRDISIRIFNLFGREEWSATLNSKVSEISLHALPAGIHVAMISHQGRVTTIKIIKL